jgi:DNA polymerase-3 subunit chi
MEVLFYHLEQQPLERVLPQLLERSLDRGWRVVVQAGSEERVDSLASLPWTYSDESFLPHGTANDGYPQLQPIWLTSGAENPNGAHVRFLVDGAVGQDIDGLMRTIHMFDGNNAEAVAQARAEWKRAKTDGHHVSYWRQDERGRWQNMAKTSEAQEPDPSRDVEETR